MHFSIQKIGAAPGCSREQSRTRIKGDLVAFRCGKQQFARLPLLVAVDGQPSPFPLHSRPLNHCILVLAAVQSASRLGAPTVIQIIEAHDPRVIVGAAVAVVPHANAFFSCNRHHLTLYSPAS